MRSAADLRRYAETIFGEPFDQGAVIRETRKSATEVFDEPEYFDRPHPEEIQSALAEAENLDQPASAQRLAVCLFPDKSDRDLVELHTGHPADSAWRIALGRLLLQLHLCQRVLKIIAETKGPASLETIATTLGQAKVLRDWEATDLRALAELVVALVAWARSGSPETPRPLFNVRLQLWIREMSRMVANLPSTLSSGQQSQVDLCHAVDLDRQTLQRALPVVTCNRCGSSAHVGRLNAGSATCWAPLDQIYEEFFDDRGGDRIRLFYHDSIDRKVNAAGTGSQIVKGLLNSQTLEFHPSDHKDIQPGPAAPVWMYDPTDAQGNIDRTCPACGHAQGLLLFGMRAARLTTGIAGTLCTSAQNEDDPAGKPRFLMFSDSVQDAAHRAAVTETRNALSVSQKSLYTALQATDTAGMTLREVIEELPARYLDDLGGDNFTAQFIAHEQTWRSRYQDLVRNGISITDPVFLEHMRIRLGWEYFVDLSYRAHFSHTLEINGMAAADIPIIQLQEPAERLARQLQNEFSFANSIDVDLLVPFLAGVLRQMRHQGSVAHPYVADAVATSQGSRGPNWFGAAAQLGLGRTRTLPVPDYRFGLAPIPITLNNGLRGFEDITRDHVSNWYRDWLFRMLGQISLVVGADPDIVYPIVLRRLEADGFLRRVEGPEGQNRHAWLVEPGQVIVSTRTATLACTSCGRREIALAENAQIQAEAPCPRIGCDGHLVEVAAQARPALRRSLASNRNHRVVAREHTGLLEADDRLRIETGFIRDEIPWAPNLISATPTLEMGIDIGDLSTLLLCSVPPEEANYVQRMGRSGRRDGNALNMVLATAQPHDLQFWEDPTPMLAGQVRPPGVFLAAEAVLLRQVTAFTLDAYVASIGEGSDYGKLREVLKRRREGATCGFPIEWLDLVQKRGNELADSFLSQLPEEVRERSDLSSRIRDYLTQSDARSIGWKIGSTFDEAAGERAHLLEKREELNSRARAATAAASRTD